MALVIGACTLGVNAQEQRAVSRLESAAIETFADGFFAAQMARLQVPGAALAIVQGQRVVFSKGYGYADLAAKVPVDPERTLFRVGSVSKLLIATAVMQLYEERRLDLHADINTYLTRFKIRDRYSTPITLAHLLTHTAGFDERVIGMWARTRPAEPLGDHLAARMPPRVRPPGDVISYSNYGMALAAHIVENVAGMSYEHYVQKRILTPLEMYRSTFAYPTTLTARLATVTGTGAADRNPLPTST